MTDKIRNLLNKDIGIIAATEIASSGIVSLGAAHFLGNPLHGPAGKIKDFIAAHLVEPHLETLFERHFGHMLHAQNETPHVITEPETEIPYNNLSREGRVDRIAATLTKESIAFLSANGLMLAAQYPLKCIFKANIDPVKITFTGASVQLGAMAVIGTLLSRPAEWIYHTLAEILPKITRMDEKKARETARTLTYVALPGLLGFAAELAVGEREHQAKR